MLHGELTTEHTENTDALHDAIDTRIQVKKRPCILCIPWLKIPLFLILPPPAGLHDVSIADQLPLSGFGQDAHLFDAHGAQVEINGSSVA